jgi:polynucleotide 5'-hydroxyl-kinase GRC3/NOL9
MLLSSFCRSTFLRYSINRLLSKNKIVAVIDCDLGQPELTLSGQISLHILTTPLLSPPYLHLRQPELSFFLGEISVKECPDLFEKCLRELYGRYTHYRDSYAQSGTLLRPDEMGQMTAQSHQRFSALDETPYERYSLPLLVNTDGLIRGMGVEILGSVLGTIHPSHVMHIATQKDVTLPAIEEARLQHKELVYASLTPGRMVPSKIAAQDLRDLR